MADSNQGNGVLIAIITTAGVLGTAIISNWEKFRPGEPVSSPINKNTSSQSTISNPPLISRVPDGHQQSISNNSVVGNSNLIGNGNTVTVTNPMTLAETQNHVLTILRQNMLYSEARQIVQKNGWQPGYPHPQIGAVRPEDAMGGDRLMGSIFYDKGFHEVEGCSGSGLGNCSFIFNSGQGRKLRIVTANNKNGDLVVWNWTIN